MAFSPSACWEFIVTLAVIFITVLYVVSGWLEVWWSARNDTPPNFIKKINIILIGDPGKHYIVVL